MNIDNRETFFLEAYRVLKKGIFVGSSTDSSIRKELEQSHKDNPRHLLDQLKKIDPKYAEIVHLNNKKPAWRRRVSDRTSIPLRKFFLSQDHIVLQ